MTHAFEREKCNARIRRRADSGTAPLITETEDPMYKYGWIGGWLTVDETTVDYEGFQRMASNSHTVVTSRHAARFERAHIAAVTKKRGVLGAPYVSVELGDGSEIQFRVGAFGSRSDDLVAALTAPTG